MIILAALGIVAFFIGLGFILNGVFLTVPKKGLADKSLDAASQRAIDGNMNDPELAQPADLFSSVTEHTTKHLMEKQPVRRD